MIATRHLAALALVAALWQSACTTFDSVPATESRPSGDVAVSSAAFGNVVLAPTACVSGESQLFLGADFVDDARGMTTRLILEPKGEATLRVFRTADPLRPGILFARADCSQFRLSFDRSGWRINDIYDVRVSVTFDCGKASGESLRGNLAAAHCH
jgi:hypothetical protein